MGRLSVVYVYHQQLLLLKWKPSPSPFPLPIWDVKEDSRLIELKRANTHSSSPHLRMEHKATQQQLPSIIMVFCFLLYLIPTQPTQIFLLSLDSSPPGNLRSAVPSLPTGVQVKVTRRLLSFSLPKT